MSHSQRGRWGSRRVDVDGPMDKILSALDQFGRPLSASNQTASQSSTLDQFGRPSAVQSQATSHSSQLDQVTRTLSARNQGIARPAPLDQFGRPLQLQSHDVAQPSQAQAYNNERTSRDDYSRTQGPPPFQSALGSRLYSREPAQISKQPEISNLSLNTTSFGVNRGLNLAAESGNTGVSRHGASSTPRFPTSQSGGGISQSAWANASHAWPSHENMRGISSYGVSYETDDIEFPKLSRNQVNREREDHLNRKIQENRERNREAEERVLIEQRNISNDAMAVDNPPFSTAQSRTAQPPELQPVAAPSISVPAPVSQVFPAAGPVAYIPTASSETTSGIVPYSPNRSFQPTKPNVLVNNFGNEVPRQTTFVAGAQGGTSEAATKMQQDNHAEIKPSHPDQIFGSSMVDAKWKESPATATKLTNTNPSTVPPTNKDILSHAAAGPATGPPLTAPQQTSPKRSNSSAFQSTKSTTMNRAINDANAWLSKSDTVMRSKFQKNTPTKATPSSPVGVPSTTSSATDQSNSIDHSNNLLRSTAQAAGGSPAPITFTPQAPAKEDIDMADASFSSNGNRRSTNGEEQSMEKLLRETRAALEASIQEESAPAKSKRQVNTQPAVTQLQAALQTLMPTIQVPDQPATIAPQAIVRPDKPVFDAEIQPAPTSPPAVQPNMPVSQATIEPAKPAHQYSDLVEQQSSTSMTKPLGNAGASLEHQTTFAAWPKPPQRAGPRAQVRRVRLTNLPTTVSASEVTSLVWGGQIESINHLPGAQYASILFVNPDECQTYFKETANGIEFPTNSQRIIEVELAQETEPVSSLVQNHVALDRTRCVRIVGIEDKYTLEDMRALAIGKQPNARKLEHFQTWLNEKGNRVAEFRFCSLLHGVAFKAQMVRDEEFEMCNIMHWTDPCAVASGVHVD